MPTVSSLSKQDWPREWVSGELDSFYGDPRGSAGRADQAWVQQNLTTIAPPWAMKSDGGVVSRITIHKKCKDSLTRILNAIWESTGRDQAKIAAAHLDQFDGSYNFRVNVNSPSRLSLHAYGAAVDLAAAENPNGTPWRDNGRMLPRWAIDAFLAEGWCWGGDFSGTPDAMHFQATFNRHADAEQGQPASISNASEPLTANTKFTVTATMFGGPKDDQAVAYADVSSDWANHPGVALPFRFRGPRPNVTVSANGKSVVCPIVDVGPWNINDAYWMTTARPQAESGTDMSGRRTNGAGIDLTPATAAAIGLDGKGQVVWFFNSTGAGTMSDAVTANTPQLNLLKLPELQAIRDQIDQIIKKNGAGLQIDNIIKQAGVAGPLTLPAMNPAQLADINKQLEMFVQLATTILPIISMFVPQLKVLIPILPVLTGLLKMGDDIAQAGNDPTKIADALTAHLKDVAQQVQAVKLPGLN
jgi:hypothetical protein